jgi:hypothetical protein
MASVCLDVVPIIRRETKPHLAFSAQIMGTQRSQRTLVTVGVTLRCGLDRSH